MAKRFQYSEEDMLKALEAVRNGMPVLKASKVFQRQPFSINTREILQLKGRLAPDIILIQKEEQQLVDWMFHVARCGFPVTKNQLLNRVQMLMTTVQGANPFTNNRPGRNWYNAFMRRHPYISSRAAQNLTSARAAVKEDQIRAWFAEIEEYLTEHDYLAITNDPKRVYNCDETAFFLSSQEDKVLVKKGTKAIYNFINNDEKECITTLIMCNANGDLPPLMVMFAYKRIPKHVAMQVGTKDLGP